MHQLYSKKKVYGFNILFKDEAPIRYFLLYIIKFQPPFRIDEFKQLFSSRDSSFSFFSPFKQEVKSKYKISVKLQLSMSIFNIKADIATNLNLLVIFTFIAVGIDTVLSSFNSCVFFFHAVVFLNLFFSGFISILLTYICYLIHLMW